MSTNSTTNEPTSPDELAPSTPRDLYPTSDIRFVLLEIGKLTAKVDRLVEDVKSQGSKLEKLRLTIAWVGGGAAALLFVMGLAMKLIPVPHLSFDGPPSTIVPAALSQPAVPKP